jgi:hypothetical protein
MTQPKLHQLLTILGLQIVLAACLAADPSFNGGWKTTFGPMQLKQDGDRVTGSYVMDGVRCTIDGSLKDAVLTLKYREPDVTGEGSFKLADDGKSFAGRWREAGTERFFPWVGTRTSDEVKKESFAGLWDSSFGRMRLIQHKDRVDGIYSLANVSSLSGKVAKDRFVFRYKEPEVEGEGWFELADGGNLLRGKWKADGSDAWREWTAKRIQPQSGRKWLVVVEARWEASLAEREYAFGDMLKAFFNRAPNVQVRRRFFNDENDLRRWCRETAFLAEPVVLCIATHGTSEGVQVSGKTIAPDAIAESLRYSDNVQLLHFSACLMMKEQSAARIIRHLGAQATFPISGYTTSVDWAASAVIEFLYFDLILIRGTAPEAAAEQVKILVPIAGDRKVPKAVLPPAGFRILLPGQPAKITSSNEDTAVSPASKDEQ